MYDEIRLTLEKASQSEEQGAKYLKDTQQFIENNYETRINRQNEPTLWKERIQKDIEKKRSSKSKRNRRDKM